MSKGFRVFVIVFLVVIVALVLDVPHLVWHYLESKRYSELFKETRVITSKLRNYVETNAAASPHSFMGFQQLGILSHGDIKFLTNHGAVFHAFRRDSPKNTIVIELTGNGPGMVGMRDGSVMLKKYVKGNETAP